MDKGDKGLIKNVDFSRNFSDVNRNAVAQCMKDIHSFDVSERVDGSSSGIKEGLSKSSQNGESPGRS